MRIKITEDFLWKFVERPRRIIMSKIYKILGWKNPEIIQSEVNRHRNELVWNLSDEIVLLLGWTDSYDDDYYYVVYSRKNGIELVSCVVGFTWLKSWYSSWDYEYKYSTYLRNCPPIEEIMQLVKDQKFILK
jgi:hypothetical protein